MNTELTAYLQKHRFQISHSQEKNLFLRRLSNDRSEGTLLYIHGLGESGLCFERVMADTRLDSWNHLTPDLAGYGKSPWPSNPLSLQRHADHLSELLEHLSLERVVIVGHSMGGVIGTLLCEKFPQKVSAFINVEGNISLPDCSYSSRAAHYPLETWLAEGYDQFLEALYRDEREASVLRPYCSSIQMCDPRTFHLNSTELVAMSEEETLANRLAKTGIPHVYLFGAPRGTGDHSRGLLSQAGVEMIGIPDAGHWPFLDQHDAFLQEMHGAVNQLTAPSVGAPPITTVSHHR